MDDWWAERHQVEQLPRLWLQHFTGTSWLAEDAAGREAATAGRLVGFLVGFISPDDRATAVCHLVGVAPSHRRRGIGRELYERFAADGRAAGAKRIVAVAWPGDPIAIKFHVRLGFEPYAGPGTQRLYGTPAVPNHDFGRVDRAILSRTL